MRNKQSKLILDGHNYDEKKVKLVYINTKFTAPISVDVTRNLLILDLDKVDALAMLEIASELIKSVDADIFKEEKNKSIFHLDAAIYKAQQLRSFLTIRMNKGKN